jgi:hypothetical protein
MLDLNAPGDLSHLAMSSAGLLVVVAGMVASVVALRLATVSTRATR